jgi:hypothetical protein
MIETIGSVAPSSISITTARPDLFFVNGAAVPSLQKKDSTFSNHREGLDAVRVNGLGVRIIDLNGDGWPDILVASDRTRNLLFHNKRGHLEEIGVPSGIAYSNDGVAQPGMGIDAAEVNHDGRPDIRILPLRTSRRKAWPLS